MFLLYNRAMTKKKQLLHQRLLHNFGATKVGTWVLARTLPHFDKLTFRISNGRYTAVDIIGGLPMVTITTIGAKSGLPRTLPLIRIPDEQNPQTFALIASNWGQQKNPAWYYNLKANPQATCVIDGQSHEYRAHEATVEEYAHFWQIATSMYVGYPVYKQRAGDRHIPIMVLEPVS